MNHAPRKTPLVCESSAGELAAVLRGEIRRLEGLRRPTDEIPLSSGSSALNRLLPDGGFCRGSLVEWLADEAGSGGAMLSLLAGREVCRAGGAVIVFDRAEEFYPPGAAALGFDLGQLLIVRPRTTADELWAWDQALCCPGVALVWGSLERLDVRNFRRLQLAAEKGGTLGFLLRAACVRGSPSWADVQLLVRPRPTLKLRRWQVELIRARGGAAGKTVELEFDSVTGLLQEAHDRHETPPLSLVSPLAPPAARRRSAGG